VIGRFVHLNPFVVLFVLVIGTSIAGPLGLILSVPVAAVLKIVIQFFHAKVMASEVRQVDVIRSATELADAAKSFSQLSNAHIVMMIEPGALSWDDLPLVQRVAAEAAEHFVNLSAVTPDSLAGTLTTAAGIPTTTLPATATAAVSATV